MKRGTERGSLEQALKQQALDHGVMLHYGQGTLSVVLTRDFKQARVYLDRAQEIRPLIRASMVNRLLYDWAGDRSYRVLLKWFSTSPDLAALTRFWYRDSPLHRMLWPIARRHQGAPRRSGRSQPVPS